MAGGHQTNVASGSTAQLTVPALTDGTSYAWRSQASDGIDSGPVTGWCEFTVDVTRPSVPPTVASADGIYLDDGDFHGGVGQTGSFTLGANGITDVRSYLYGLADPPTTEVAASSLGGTATVSVTPQFTGLTTLYVRSKDRAGNLSDIQRYTFLAGSATGPAAWYRMDEGSGSTLNDSSGHGLPATLGGTTSWTAGRSGGGDHAVTFDGATGHAASSGPAVPTDQSYAVAAWVRLAPGGLPTHNVTAVGQDGSYHSAFYLGLRNISGAYRWSFSLPWADSGLDWSMTADTTHAPVTGRWTYLVGVYDAAAAKISLYVDGTLVDTESFTTPWSATGPVQIGRVKWAGGYTDSWPGDVDDVRIWDRAVFGPEIGRIYNASTLAGEWTFEDGFGTTAFDSSGRGHDAALTSGATWGVGHDGAGALALDGTTGSADTTGPVILTDQSFTVAAWVKVDDLSDYRTAVSQSGTSASAFYLQYSKAFGRWAMISPTTDSTSPPAYVSARSLNAPTVGVWTHLVGVYDAGAHQLRLYVNGQLEGTASNVTLWNATGRMHLGSADSTNFLAGGVDDVRVYVGVLSDQQIADLANS